MTHFIKSGSQFHVAADAALDVRSKLPVDTYTIKMNEQTGEFYLEIIEGYEIKGKIYGDTPKQADRILSTFADRPNSTGVMLSGEKGSGKTLLAKIISLEAAKQDIPTIVINNPWCGEKFNVFIQTIEQPTIIIFDEFEKVYDREEQEKMLTLLDGVYPSKKLYIITCNDRNRVNSHMQNRPGRIYYRLNYSGLTAEFIAEYATENLKNQGHVEDLKRLGSLFGEFNFDMLKAIVEEMNRYDESPDQVIKMLNAKPEYDEGSQYQITLSEASGKKVEEDALHDDVWYGNPFSGPIRIPYRDSDRNRFVRSEFSIEDLVSMDAAIGKFVFKNSKSESLTLKKVLVNEYSFDALDLDLDNF